MSDTTSKFCIKDLRHQIKLLSCCLICLQNNVQGLPLHHDALPPPQVPFESLKIDFTHMPQVGPHKMLLVIVDRFSKWVDVLLRTQKRLYAS